MKTKSMMWAAEPRLLAIAPPLLRLRPAHPTGRPSPYDAVSESLLWSFAGSPDDGANPTASLIADKSGNIYTARHSSGRANGDGTVSEPTEDLRHRR